MSDTTTFLTPVVLQASTSVAAGSPLRVARDIRTAHGGVLTARVTNGGTGPGAQCVVTVHVAHDSGVLPATGAEGAVWKTYQVLGGGGTAANASTPFTLVLPPMCHFQVEFAGNTVQPVTVEAQFTEYTKLVTTG